MSGNIRQLMQLINKWESVYKSKKIISWRFTSFYWTNLNHTWKWNSESKTIRRRKTGEWSRMEVCSQKWKTISVNTLNKSTIVWNYKRNKEIYSSNQGRTSIFPIWTKTNIHEYVGIHAYTYYEIYKVIGKISFTHRNFKNL